MGDIFVWLSGPKRDFGGWIYSLLLGGALLLISGCTSLPKEERGEVLNLAPQTSTRYQCGPSTLAAVMAWYGTEVEEETISAAIYSPTARGVLITDLARYARSRGFVTEIRTGTLADLEEAVAGGNPPIVLLDLGRGRMSIPHFTAIIGWSETGLAYQDRGAGGKWESQQTFLKQWKRSGQHYLSLTPAL